MAKPEWGAKRICHSCGTRYYDMRRDPVICPKCGAEYDPEAFLKSRRTRSAAADEPVGRPAAKKKTAKVAVISDDVETDDADDDLDDTDDDDDDLDADADALDLKKLDDDLDEDDDEPASPVIEDTDELGDDDAVEQVVVDDDDKDMS
ncbi:MAG: TIGR02300 family protein [Inquilinaceae bacterium]